MTTPPTSPCQKRLPPWLRRKPLSGCQIFQTDKILEKHHLNTVCEEAKCPNRLECYAKRTATFLVLGKSCTRSCGFCDIATSKSPLPPEPDEPERVALSAQELGLSHVVVTMVSRDDLSDGGAEHLAAVLRALRQKNPRATLEILTSDFQGNHQALDIVLAERPEIFNHNIETVRSISPHIRHVATYSRSLDVLQHAKSSGCSTYVKSGLLLGFGETSEEVCATLRDLVAAGCDIVTIGQYLQPNPRKLRVKEYIPPDQFQFYEKYGKELGLKHVYAGPFVRSSYHAHLFAPKEGCSQTT